MRIDDDSAERAQAEARAQDKKLQKQAQQKRTEEATAFDKRLESQKQSTGTQKSFAEAQKSTARSAIQQMLGQSKETSVEGKLEGRLEQNEVESLADDAHFQEMQGDQQKLQRGASGRREVDRKTGRQIESGRGEDAQVDTGSASRAQSGQREVEGKQIARRDDAKTSDHQQEGRDERGQPGAGAKKGALPAEQRVNAREEKGSGGQQGQGGGSNPQPGAFRLPPAALMAPPPVAVPKETGQVSRLRQLAQEIAEKIVKHARIGVNRMGLPEFQVELKSDILKGLKVKVSGRHGRIRATFTSRDPAVLKQLRGEVENLRNTLTARGLKVDALEIEEERA